MITTSLYVCVAVESMHPRGTLTRWRHSAARRTCAPQAAWRPLEPIRANCQGPGSPLVGCGSLRVKTGVESPPALAATRQIGRVLPVTPASRLCVDSPKCTYPRRRSTKKKDPDGIP